MNREKKHKHMTLDDRIEIQESHNKGIGLDEQPDQRDFFRYCVNLRNGIK